MIIQDNLKYRVDEDKLEDALRAANFLAKNFIETGRYTVDETWGPEGLLYLAESSYALHSAYEIKRDEIFIGAVKSILDELRKIQKKSGGWGLELGKDGVGFKTTDEVRKLTAEIEDLPPTVAVLKTIADYQKITGDKSYSDIGDKAFEYLMNHWDVKYGSFLEKENNKLMALRSNPRSYHLFSFIGILAWRDHSPEIIDEILPYLLRFIKDTFESYDDQTMPLVYGLHAANLVQHTSEDYIKNVIKPRIDNHLVYNETFRIKELKGAYGHRDGLRGIVKDEAHLRSAAGVAIAMKFYDLYTNTRTYRDTGIYKDVENWIQNMKSGSFYYEFEQLPERKKIGYGSPGQYLPIWWIVGKI
ncbi:hypothetical protein [Chryseolinea sp. H1M3-3]|uniref:hypothetical protein n=1 Tax=Chryseolinea sp. H1M3-3 TaxID=3034144 RepID=UPI0023EC7420|nr:hypothetical protein [Chryseolinea sp. H1M3-3]